MMIVSIKKIFNSLVLLCIAASANGQGSVTRLNEKADSLIAEKNYEEASKILDKSIRIAPSAKAYENKGVLSAMSGDSTNALQYMDMALLLDPSSSSVYRNKAIISSRQGKYNAALAEINKAMELGLNTADAFCVRAGIKNALHLFNECLLDFDKAMTLNPKSDSIYVLKAKAILYELDDPAKAIAELNTCLKKFPESVYALEMRVVYNIELKDYQSIIHDITALLAITPAENHRNYYHSRGMAKSRSGDPKGACEDMNKARLLGSGEAFLYMYDNCQDICTDVDFKADALAHEADFYSDRRLYEKAIENLQKAISLLPKVNNYHYQLARVKFRQGYYEEALPHLTTALKLKSDDCWSLLMVGQCKMYLEDNKPKKDFSVAKEYMKKAILSCPEEMQLYYTLGLLYLDTQDYINGVKNLEMAVQIDPKQTDIYMALGEAYLLLNDKEKACFNFNKAKALGSGKAYSKVIMNCK